MLEDYNSSSWKKSKKKNVQIIHVGHKNSLQINIVKLTRNKQLNFIKIGNFINVNNH